LDRPEEIKKDFMSFSIRCLHSRKTAGSPANREDEMRGTSGIVGYSGYWEL